MVIFIKFSSGTDLYTISNHFISEYNEIYHTFLGTFENLAFLNTFHTIHDVRNHFVCDIILNKNPSRSLRTRGVNLL